MAIPDITALSLRARLAIALRLFAAYCGRRGLDHPEVAAYLEHLWRLVALFGPDWDVPAWPAGQPPLVDAGLGGDYPPGFREFLADRGLPEREFRRALCLATEALYSSMYGAANESVSRQCVGELAELVAPLGVAFPDTRPFARSRWADGQGWGEPPSAEELAAWRGGRRAEPGAAADRPRDRRPPKS